jgi:hypothetical protein
LSAMHRPAQPRGTVCLFSTSAISKSSSEPAI